MKYWKKNKTLRLFYTTLGFILLLGSVPMSRAENLVLLANGEWPPYTSQHLERYGVYSHIVSEAFALEGMTVKYEFFPWKRSYVYVKDGDCDGSLTWAPTPEKKQEVFFSDPVFQHTKVFFHLKNFPFDWTTMDDLKAISIGATALYTYGDEFDQAAKNGRIQAEYTTTDILNLKKLRERRIQIFPSDINVGYDLVNTNFTPEEIGLFTHHPKPIQKAFTCVIFTKKNPEKSLLLLETFNRGLGKLKEQGTYDKLLKAYLRGEYRLK